MSPQSLPLRRLRAGANPWRRAARLERLRVKLGDSMRTTVHVATYELDAFRPRVTVLEQPLPLIRFCEQHGVSDAVVGGFFSRPQYAPLGELRIAGQSAQHVPFAAPWDEVRACVHVHGDAVRIAPRDELAPEPPGDLLQAGPQLVTDGRRVVEEGSDAEGFAAASHQFDSDITAGRYPRTALGIVDDRLLAVACDGRTRRDAGMTLVELADQLVALGATSALNLDGGGSASLVYDGRLRNRPREQHGADLLDGRPIVTALLIEPR